jgi:hypothetical protein
VISVKVGKSAVGLGGIAQPPKMGAVRGLMAATASA